MDEQLTGRGGEPDPDVSRWTTSALVGRVRALLTDEDRSVGGASSASGARLFQRCVDQLTSRGLDGDSLVRYGLCVEVVSPLVGVAIASQLGFGVAESPLRDEALQQWLGVLALPDAAPLAAEGPEGAAMDSAQLIQFVGHLVSGVMAWGFAAPIADLFDLKPPTREQLCAARFEAAPDTRLIEDYRWLVERFAVDLPARWQTSSLHREHRWNHGNEVPPCPVALMDEAAIDSREIDRNIALRAVSQAPGRDGERWQGLAAQMQGQAKRSLSAGRFAEAAALFEFAVQQTPEDAMAWNNLGFCLVNLDPERAIFSLERAHQLGYVPVAVNIHNRLTCHLLLSQERIARNLAEEYWATALEHEVAPIPATLWLRNDAGEVVLRDVPDARSEVVRAAYSLSGPGERDVWEQRISSLN